MAGLLEDLEVSAIAGARARKLRLQNAFDYTRPHSHVRLQARAMSDRVLFEIEDQCGGIPPDRCDHLLEQYAEQGNEGTGLVAEVRHNGTLSASAQHCRSSRGERAGLCDRSRVSRDRVGGPGAMARDLGVGSATRNQRKARQGTHLVG